MTRIAHCQACHNEKFGIKTRLPVPHTCGKELPVIGDTLSGAGCKIKGCGNMAISNEGFCMQHFYDNVHQKNTFLLPGYQNTQNELWTEVERIMQDNSRSTGTKIAYLMSKFELKRK